MKTTIITAIAAFFFSANIFANQNNEGFLPSDAAVTINSSANALVGFPTEIEMHEILTEAMSFERAQNNIGLPTEDQMFDALTEAISFEKKFVSLPSETQLFDALTEAINFEKSHISLPNQEQLGLALNEAIVFEKKHK